MEVRQKTVELLISPYARNTTSPIMRSMPYIHLSGKRGRGQRTLVDQDIYEQYGHLSWYLSDTGYAMRSAPEGRVRLHRLVAGTPEGFVTDHKNHDRLDNRRSNLRVVTQAENAENYKGEKGYTWDASKRKYMVRYRKKFYGRYPTEEEAKLAYQLARSGVPYQTSTRKRYMLPRGVFYMKSQSRFGKPYYIRPQIRGTKHFKGYFASVEEAQLAYTTLIRKLGKEK